jgi:AbrB family looped-hinge helix DNA binding protein
VTVTRKGQTTIPKDLRDKYGIREGTKLDVTDSGDGVLLRRSVSSVDLIGSSKLSYDELKKRLDAIRREDA